MIGIFFVAVLWAVNFNRIIIGVKAGSISLAMKNKDQAREILTTETVKFYEQKVVIVYNDLVWEIFPEDLGINFDISRSVEKYWDIGRGQKNIFFNIGRQIKGVFRGYDLPLEINLDRSVFAKFYQKKLAYLDKPARNASFAFKGDLDNFTVIKEEWGKIINKEKLIKEIGEKAAFLSDAPIKLEIVADNPEVTILESEIAKEFIKYMAGNVPFSLTLNGKKWEISENDLIDFLEFPAEYPEEIEKYFLSAELQNYNKNNRIMGVNLNEKKVVDYLTIMSTGINSEPTDAQLRFENGRVVVFALSQNGLRIDTEKSAENIVKSIKSGGDNTELIYQEIEPNIRTSDIDNLGIVALLGKGESNFWGSPESRKHNIKVGAAKFHGVLIKSNEEFSFNKILGEVGAQTGYLPALVIKDKKLIPEYGGGLCQVSTTIFRAAINAGLKITERFAHAFPITYYGPPGFDATIYPPNPDLRFVNNTSGHILAQTKIIDNNLIVELYGTNDGRSVKVIGPTQYDIKPDGSMKAVLVQEVYDSKGDIIQKDTFYSNYKSPSLYPIDRNPLE
mgnify:CR=1 FL=1